MAASTGDGSSAPEAHDEPAAAHTPSRSSATSSISAATPSTRTWWLPATTRERSPVGTTPGTDGEPGRESVTQPADAGDLGGSPRRW